MTISKIVFTSDELPASLGDQDRFSLWRDLCTELFCHFEFERPDDRPFTVKLEYVQLGVVGLSRCAGTVTRCARTSRDIATDGNDDVCFGINLGGSALQISQSGKDYLIEPERAGLFLHDEASDLRGGPSNGWFTLNVPRLRLTELVANVEDLMAPPPGLPSEALRHLRQYAGLLLGPNPTGEDPLLAVHIGTTLLDLIALSLGARKDARELGELRGLRAARLQAIVAVIKAGFSDPAFSVHDVALGIGLAPRYVQNLLTETGASFSERVLELRLQKARAMLASRRQDKMKVSEIAYACGFSEASYFNRCFRRRFGASPTQYRDSKDNQV